MNLDTSAIKSLRDSTGAGIMDCKKALEKAKGDLAEAQEILKGKGVALAAKKADRQVTEGLIETYVHVGNRMGAIVEVNCETDFVARTPEFKQLAHDLAMQIAAMDPKFIGNEDLSDIPSESHKETSLLQQLYIKDPSMSIQDLVNEVVGKVGENIRIRRFSRFLLGE